MKCIYTKIVTFGWKHVCIENVLLLLLLLYRIIFTSVYMYREIYLCIKIVSLLCRMIHEEWSSNITYTLYVTLLIEIITLTLDWKEELRTYRTTPTPSILIETQGAT